MPSQTMIAVVARAIEAAELQWKAENGGDEASCVDCPDELKAEAAIRAMREPSNAMLNAAAKSMSPGRRPTPERVSVQEKHRIRFQAMIDACLPNAVSSPAVSAEEGEER